MTVSEHVRAMVKFNLTGEIGPVIFQRLVQHFGSPEEALKADFDRVRMVEGIGKIRAAKLTEAPKYDVDEELELAEKAGVRILAYTDPDYPSKLKEVENPPIILYVKGDIQSRDALALAIVGTRRCTLYGKKQAERFGTQLARRGFTIVSGLAYGIDAKAHAGALKAKGRTLAVLPNGLGSIYPPEHQNLADEISENGALVSEFPMRYSVNKENFPRRNRIISGLSLGTIVIEAPMRSGALITARWATEQNREVFAVPGQIDSKQSAGSNTLIKNGAKLTEGLEDILEELGPLPESITLENKRGDEVKIVSPKQMGLNDRELAIYSMLSVGSPKHIDEIIRESELPVSAVNSALMIMELKKYVKQLSGKLFIRN